MKSLVSLVVPAYQEGECLSLFYDSLVQILDNISEYDFEILFVDDWSKDDTWFRIVHLSMQDTRVRGVHFSRNFWKEIALTAGIEAAKGEAVITLDADGQHPVVKIPEFLAERENWYEIVYNQRPTTQWASWIKTMSSKLFYACFNSISDFKLEAWTTDYRLMDRKVVDYFLLFREKNRLYRWLVDWMWFQKKALVFEALPRMGWGSPSYSYAALLKLAMNSVTSFSLYPLKVVGHMGVAITIIALVLIAVMLYNILLHWNSMDFNNTSLLVVVCIFLSWITMASLWMIALYIANIHEEVMERPLYIVRDTVGDVKEE